MKEIPLKEIMSEIKIEFSNKKIDILLDSKALRSAHIGAATIAERLKEKGFKIKGNDLKLTILVEDLDFKAIYKLKEKLKDTVLSGIKGVRQVVVANRGREYVIIAAGSELKEVLEFKGVDKNRVTSNDVHDVAAVLGIEAARQTIINEITAHN